jgi:hypothetical protein
LRLASCAASHTRAGDRSHLELFSASPKLETGCLQHAGRSQVARLPLGHL